MRAAVLEQPGVLGIREVADPKPTPTSVVVKVRSVGLCASDVRALKYGSPRISVPAIIGHEVSGEIVEVGSRVPRWKVRDAVAIGSGVPCGACRYCRAGMANLCETDVMIGYQMPGGLAEYLALSSDVLRHGSVVRLTRRTSFDEAAMAEPLACVLHGFEQVRFSRAQSVAIIGAGPVGHMMAKVARHLGASRVALVGKTAAQLRPAHADGVSTVRWSRARAQTRQQLLELSRGLGYHAVMVACSDTDAQALAMDIVAKRGWVNLFGPVQPSTRLVEMRSNDVHYKEVAVTGSHGASPEHHRQAVALLESKQLNLGSLISHTFPLNRIHQAFDAMEQAGHLKIIIRPHGA